MNKTALFIAILACIEQGKASVISKYSSVTLNPIQLEAENDSKLSHTIDKEQIEKVSTLGDAVKHISGVQSSAFGPNAGAPVIRSLDGHRVGVFENGTSIQGISAISGNINIPFNPLFAESIQLTKSNNSVRYGDQALGGSVEIDNGLIPKTINEKSRELDLILKKGWNQTDAKGFKLKLNNQKNFATNIQFSRQDIQAYSIPGKSKAKICEDGVFTNGGVNSTLADRCQKDARIKSTYNKASQKYMNQIVVNNPDWADGDFSFYTDDPTSQAGGQIYQNPVNPDYVPNTAQYKTEQINTDVTPNYHKKLGNSYAVHDNMAIGATYFLKDGYIGLSADYKKSAYGVPGFSMQNLSFQSNYDDGLPVGVKTEQNTLMLEGVLNQPLSFVDQLQLKASNLVNKSGEYIGAREANLYRFQQNFIELVAKQKEFSALSGEMGVMMLIRDVDGQGSARYLPNVKTDRKAFFIQEKLNFQPFYLEAGYRKEKVNHQMKDQTFELARNANNRKLEDRTFDLQHYYLGGGIFLGDYVHLHTKYSQSERAPELNELYASHPHYSVMTQEEGDQNLRPESVKTFELNADFTFDQTQLAIALYRMDYQDFMYLSHSGTAMGNRLPLMYWKQKDVVIDGFELDIHHRILLNQWGNVTLSAFGDFVKNRVKNTDTLNLSNDGEYPLNMPTNRYGASIEWENKGYTMRLSNTYYDQPKYLGKSVNTELPLDAYQLLDLSLSKKVNLKNSEIDLYLNGTNLLNEEARPHNSPLKYIAPLPGRGFQLGITLHL